MIYFTSDHHAYHKNIIRYCDRPFKDSEEMTEVLISNFNSRVTKRDTTYFLGDTVWGLSNYKSYFERLNGQKWVVLGNHDNKQAYTKLLVDKVISGLYEVKNLTIDKDFIVLNHYAQRGWNRAHYGAYHLYGHCHNTIPDYGRSCDIGVDKWDYFPVSWEEIKEYFGDRKEVCIKVRDSYEKYKLSFETHFANKYKERTEKEVTFLETVL
jgi:calcineurin-like phosphoesterase family protein